MGDEAITGTLKYVTGYTGFDGSHPELQEGNFIVLKCESTVEDVTFTVTVTNPVTLDPDGIVILRIADKATQTITVVASKEGYESVTKVYALTGLTCEAAPEPATTTITIEPTSGHSSQNVSVVEDTESPLPAGIDKLFKVTGTIWDSGDEYDLNLDISAETGSSPAEVTVTLVKAADSSERTEEPYTGNTYELVFFPNNTGWNSINNTLKVAAGTLTYQVSFSELVLQ